MPSIVGYGAFVSEIIRAMVWEAFDGGRGFNWPDIAAPGGELRTRRGLEHQIEMRVFDAFVPEYDVV